MSFLSKQRLALLPELALLIVILSTGHSLAGTSRVSSLLMGKEVKPEVVQLDSFVSRCVPLRS